jgi:uncharacterized protein (TIGR03032 family)
MVQLPGASFWSTPSLILGKATPVSWHTGDLNTHDIAFANGQLGIANTRFSCLAKLSDEHSFTPQWRPSFISDIVPENRCHLNGLAIVKNEPRYVTCLGETDTPGGWREHKATGGIVIDITTNEVVMRDLAMPHSPRYYRNHLYVLNSGAGELLRFDYETGNREVVCELPGYLRGLSFLGAMPLLDYAKFVRAIYLAACRFENGIKNYYMALLSSTLKPESNKVYLNSLQAVKKCLIPSFCWARYVPTY